VLLNHPSSSSVHNATIQVCFSSCYYSWSGNCNISGRQRRIIRRTHQPWGTLRVWCKCGGTSGFWTPITRQRLKLFKEPQIREGDTWNCCLHLNNAVLSSLHVMTRYYLLPSPSRFFPHQYYLIGYGGRGGVVFFL
jgi:hypothetical protein